MLQKLGFLPGFNKQITSTGAEAQWTGGENVRFRYGTPEKIGGWAQLGSTSLCGPTRALHHMVNKTSIKYAALGTNRILYVYTGGVYYDIHPIKTDFGALTNALASTSSSAILTITLSSTSGMTAGDILFLENVTPPTGSGYSAADFDNKTFMITSVVDATSVTITMGSNANSTATDGDLSVKWYYPVGPAQQIGIYGYGISTFGGTAIAAKTTTLSAAITSTGQTTGITLTSVLDFPTSGTSYILVGTEFIKYTGISGTELTGVVRAQRGTSPSTYSSGATVTNGTDYVGWGEASTSTDSVADPGQWSLDNLGQTLIALIVNGPVFEWDSNLTNATATRATIISGAPTASRDMLVSTPDRHLVLLGTETTIGDITTQDDMFIRFSSQEDINTYTPSATNTAGTQRLADGSRIVGAIRGRDAIYVWTDTALFIMRFVGPPFTFSFQQVGTNCGLIGKNAAVEVDGTAYWMSDNGFFRYTGKLESLPCLVEDHVYDDINAIPKQHVNVGLNNLFGEIMWFYPSSGSGTVNRMVAYNYLDSTPQRPVWTTGTLARTAWQDSAVFGKPHATEYNASGTTPTTSKDHVIGCTDGVSTYFEHETGLNQIKGGAITAITASIESGDFDIGQQGLAGDGEFMMKIRRVIPDFLAQTGDARITLNLKDFPNDTAASSSLGPFTVTSGTQKIDTRARARSISLKIDNTSTSQFWKLGTFRIDYQPDGRR